ncbi:MAG: hypothetical protein IPJ61_17630 [Tessaracoccus sp.]|uniref:hypothetical protein n=1 Tax=Tessaracoccus sp. TaxID=1971211 RepID=UPI001ECA2AFF|nr:hypothetical protein [Tessaracoccus sp.]MBK7822826.1 hypothetical protein [Tessaracoccus sp.]
MTRLRHPESGAIVEVTDEKAERLGWPLADEAEPGNDDIEDADEAEPVRPARARTKK